jgi:hypothetical protein
MKVSFDYLDEFERGAKALRKNFASNFLIARSWSLIPQVPRILSAATHNSPLDEP